MSARSSASRPGCLRRPPTSAATSTSWSIAEGEEPELRFRLSASDGQATIAERSIDGRPDATVTGSRADWVRALGPEGSMDEVDTHGDRALADQLLGGFVRAAQNRAAVRAA